MIDVDIQLACGVKSLPTVDQFEHWAKAAVGRSDHDMEVVVRIVDKQESAKLNKAYRHREGPTNVLSFRFEIPVDIPLNLLGDLIICAPVVEQEAAEQNKSFEAHCAHMVVHGILHLLGFDHTQPQEILEMETEEIKILEDLGFSNPYEEVVSI